MTREALDIVLRLWGDEPEFDHQGKYWHVTKTGTLLGTLKPHIMPFQKPHPRSAWPASARAPTR
jgi:alkanesulfonate monooxygenase SsuD/methylene tetrahydromethanopterin reductase-like flavin-dependent oxidoreductase (luciferase family)